MWWVLKWGYYQLSPTAPCKVQRYPSVMHGKMNAKEGCYSDENSHSSFFIAMCPHQWLSLSLSFAFWDDLYPMTAIIYIFFHCLYPSLCKTHENKVCFLTATLPEPWAVCSTWQAPNTHLLRGIKKTVLALNKQQAFVNRACRPSINPTSNRRRPLRAATARSYLPFQNSS